VSLCVCVFLECFLVYQVSKEINVTVCVCVCEYIQ